MPVDFRKKFSGSRAFIKTFLLCLPFGPTRRENRVMAKVQPTQSEERRKKNEEDFRAFNVANRQAMEVVMDDDSKREFPLGMVCECSNPNCFERIELSVSERRLIRKDSNMFVIVPGHQDESIEEVVGESQSYALVKKFRDL